MIGGGSGTGESKREPPGKVKKIQVPESDEESVTNDISSEYNIEKSLQMDLLSPKGQATSKEFEGNTDGPPDAGASQEREPGEKEKGESESAKSKTPNRFEKNKKKREEITKKLVYDEKDMNDKYFSFLNSYELLFGKNRGSLQKRTRQRQRELELQHNLLDKKNRSIFKMYSKGGPSEPKGRFRSVLESFFKRQISGSLNRNDKIMETKQ